MKAWRHRVLLVLMTLTACVAPSPTPTAPPGAELATAFAPLLAGEVTPRPTATRRPTRTPIPPSDTERSLTILYTNDEHGWLAGIAPGQGAAELAGLWQAEACWANASCLILSGGDMWTGPAVSTWFYGESMIEVLNALGYSGAAVGNHEFDFGLDVLAERAQQATFPFLSANVRYRDSGRPPSGIQPYAVRQVNGIVVGLIGLTTQRTTTTTNPTSIRELVFTDYGAALQETLPIVRAAGAQLIVVPSHLCRAEIEALAAAAADLGVHVIGGGHCNELWAAEEQGVMTLGGGQHLEHYAYATITWDTATAQVTQVTAGVRPNRGGAPDPAVAALTARWQAAADEALGLEIGYLAQPLPRHSPAMQALVTHSWLWGVAGADGAATNLGGLRADLPAGSITLADILGVLPFDNVLVDVSLTGAAIIEIFGGRDDVALAGIYFDGQMWRESSGAPLAADKVYRVVVNDFMYAGGDDFTLLATHAPEAYNTGIDWRQPVIDWIMAQDSSPTRPLDAALADLMP